MAEDKGLSTALQNVVGLETDLILQSISCSGHQSLQAPCSATKLEDGRGMDTRQASYARRLCHLLALCKAMHLYDLWHETKHDCAFRDRAVYMLEPCESLSFCLAACLSLAQATPPDSSSDGNSSSSSGSGSGSDKNANGQSHGGSNAKRGTSRTKRRRTVLGSSDDDDSDGEAEAEL